MKLSHQQRVLAHKSLIYFGSVLACIICVFPFYYAILTSLRSGQELFQAHYLPSGFHWSNYVTALLDNGIARSLLNSVAVATITVASACWYLLPRPLRWRAFRFVAVNICCLLFYASQCFPKSRCCQGCLNWCVFSACMIPWAL